MSTYELKKISQLPAADALAGSELLPGVQSGTTKQITMAQVAAYIAPLVPPGPTGPTGPAGPTGATGATGPEGPAGTNGVDGDDGADGVGVPAGGTTGQVLAKVDSTDYNTTWVTPSNIVASVNGLTGAVVLDDGDVKSVVTTLTSGTTVTVDCSLGRNFTLTLGHNVGTLTLSNLHGSGYVTEIEIEIKQPSSGGPYTFALPASFKALGGSDTAIASTANAVTVLSAKTFDNGTTWRYAMQESA